jgi:hypothetical protein
MLGNFWRIESFLDLDPARRVISQLGPCRRKYPGNRVDKLVYRPPLIPQRLGPAHKLVMSARDHLGGRRRVTLWLDPRRVGRRN